MHDMSTSASRSRHWLSGMIGGGVLTMLLSAGALPSRTSIAFAQNAPPSTSPQQRIHELEQRVKILELENETLDRRVQLDQERYGRAFEDFEKRLRALEE